jgi:hypothetical protein
MKRQFHAWSERHERILDEGKGLAMNAKIVAFLALLTTNSVFASDDSIDDHVVKATSLAKVGSTRTALTEYVWGSSSSWATVTAKLPNAVQHNYVPKPDDALPARVDNVQSIDRLDVTTSASTKTG